MSKPNWTPDKDIHYHGLNSKDVGYVGQYNFATTYLVVQWKSDTGKRMMTEGSNTVALWKLKK